MVTCAGRGNPNDCDERQGRLDYAQGRPPDDLHERVFILGTRKEPQDLKRAMSAIGSFEAIGQALAEDCRTGTQKLWSHPELAQNAGELGRLNADVAPWLFS